MIGYWAYGCLLNLCWISTVKDQNAAENTLLGPISDAIGYSVGVGGIMVIEIVAKKSLGERPRVEVCYILRRTKLPKVVILVALGALFVEVNGNLMNSPRHYFDEACREERRARWYRVKVMESLESPSS